MAKGMLLDKQIEPDSNILVSILGEQKALWDSIVQNIIDTFPKYEEEWKFYGKAWGWALVCKSNKKQMVYLTPNKDYFQVSFIFNEKAREISKISGFSDEVIRTIETGKSNPAGGTFDFDVKKSYDLNLVKQLLQIKFDS